jgi:hypothetical protein
MRGFNASPQNSEDPWTWEHALFIAEDVERHPLPDMGAPAATPPGDHATPEPLPLEGVVKTFRHWLHLPDAGILYVTLGAHVANLMPGDPEWLLVVAPPGSGKTEVLQSLARLPRVHLAATITEPALLSGTPKKDSLGKGGLLREIGEFGVLLLKDFGSILSMRHESRAAVLAALREIYDGTWTRHLGTDGGTTLTWKGKLGLIAGCTPAIDSHHAVISSLGERFLLYRLPIVEAPAQARKALANIGHELEMRTALSNAVGGLFAGLDTGSPPRVTNDDLERIVHLATLATRCRSAVERDPFRREIDLIPEPEAPGRLAAALARLLGGMLAIGVSRSEAFNLTIKVGLDCMPALRHLMLDYLLVQDEPVDTTNVATCAGYPTVTARRALEDLAAHGIVERLPEGHGKADCWVITEWARQEHTLTFSEKSSGI